jgi:diadenosine tetraphosphate (Ap4A) HIT family hydrolase
MKKRNIIIGASVIGLLLIPLCIIFFLNVYELHQKHTCAFCDSSVLAHQKFYEDDVVLCLYSHKPICPGHCLIIPKRHVEKIVDLTDKELLAVMHAVKKINVVVQSLYGPCSYLILQKNGKEVGQTVPHVHIHYIPKKITDSSIAVFGLLFDFFLSTFHRPMDDKNVNEMAKTFQLAWENCT